MSAPARVPPSTALTSRPIGVFDSGLGGLTVVRALQARLPHESIVYLGDTARVPYGTRSEATVLRYARGCAQVLIERGVKLLVVACNTASAVALDALRESLDVPVVGVIEPGAKAAVGAAQRLLHAGAQGARIGVLGTLSTVASGAYPRAVRQLCPELGVEVQSAPLFVPLVEEGWVEGEVPRLIVERYLEALLRHEVQVIVLGCTHYPLLKPLIAQVAERLSRAPIAVVDGAEATALEVEGLLQQAQLSAALPAPGALQLLVTDLPRHFELSVARFLGRAAPEAELVDIAVAASTGPLSQPGWASGLESA